MSTPPLPRRPLRGGKLVRAAVLLALLGLVGCKDSKTNLPFTAAQAPGLVTGPVDIAVTVRDTTGQLVAVLVEVSDDNLFTFKQATPVPGAPPIPMFQASSSGTVYFFRWDPIKDLGPGIHRNVALRVNTAGGDVGTPTTIVGITVDLSDRLDPVAAGGPSLTRPLATPLADGSVWVVGGTPTGSTAPAAGGTRFDPVTGTFAVTAGLTEARARPGLALLADGAVLVAGGADAADAPRPTADLFRLDASGATSVVATGPLVVARDGPAVAALADGRAVVVGGRGAGGAPVPEVELFTPAPGGGSFALAFTDARAARAGATATPLADGRVLVAGGVDGAGQPVLEALLLDAAGTAFTSVGNAQPRAEHAATRLADGRVLLVGGTTVAGDPTFAVSTVDLYDPVQAKFLSVQPMSRRRFRPGLAYAGGRALAVGGDVSPLPAAETLDPDTLQWSLIDGQSASVRADAVAVATGPGRALVVGGGAAPEVYTPDAMTQVGGETFDEVQSVPAARADHTASVQQDGSVLVVGGTSRAAPALATVERYEPNARRFSPRAPLIHARTAHAAVVGVFGGLLVVGGKDAQGLVAEAELYDPSNDRWSAAGSLLVPRTAATLIGLSDGTVLVSGGFDAAGAPLAEQEVWSLTTKSFTATASLSEARGEHEAISFGGSILVGPGQGSAGATGGADVGVASLAGGVTMRGIPSVGPRGRAALSAPSGFFGEVLAAGGEDAAGAPRGDVAFVDLRVQNPGWLATTRPLVVARARARATALPGGFDALITGGRGAATPALDEAEIFVATLQGALELGTSRRPLDTRQVKARTRHTATILVDQRILLVGGVDERGVAIAGAELFRR